MSKLSASIVLATYNGEKYITEQLDSVFQQMNQNDEIIIFDDCSTDQTVFLINQIFDKYRNLNKNLFINNMNCGPKKSFEKAMEIVSKEIVVLIDQDDIWLKDRLNRIKKILSTFDFCTLNSYHWNSNEEKSFKYSELTFNLVTPSNKILNNIIKPSFIGCHMAFKSSYLKFILPFPKVVYMHDMFIGIFSILTKKIYIDNSPSMIYRRHNGCFTPKNTSFNFKIAIRIRYLLALIYAKMKLSFFN